MRDPKTVGTIAEFEREARRVLPRKIYDFYAGGNPTLMEHERSAIDAVALTRRMMTDVSEPSVTTRLFGADLAFPVLTAPCGLQGALWPRGELAVADVARRRGVGFVASANAAESYEDMAQANGDGLKLLQMSLFRDRDVRNDVIDRARDAGYDGILLLTQDRVTHPRHAKLVTPTVRDILDGSRRLGWARRFARHRFRLENYARYLDADASLIATLEMSNQMVNPSATWEDLEDLRRRWNGWLIVKGPDDAEDTQRLIDTGADGVVVSTSGGRTAHPGVASFASLATVVEAADGQVPVLVDGQIKSGEDIARALALGADAVIIGRALMWGLAAAGAGGALRVLDLLQEELEAVIRSTGVNSLQELRRGAIVRTG